MTHSADTVEAAPFVGWLRRQVGLPENVALNGQVVDGTKELAQRLGRSERWLWRYIRSLNANGSTDEFDRDQVEDALHNAGVGLWELYPDLAHEDATEVTDAPLTAFCPKCREHAVTNDDGTCVWCDTQTGYTELVTKREPMEGEGPGECLCGCGSEIPKRRTDGRPQFYRKGHGRRERDPETGRMLPILAPKQFVCPDCGGAKTPEAKRCWSCRLKAGHRGPNRRYRPQKMTEAQLEEAKRLYYQGGLGFRAIGKLMCDQTGYENAATMGQALYPLFKRRGWKARSQSEATAAQNWKHGFKQRASSVGYARYRRENGMLPPYRPTCKAPKTQAPRKGSPCKRPAMKDSKFCHSHDPRRAAALESHLVRVRARQRKGEIVPLEPLTVWMRARYAEVGTLRALAALIGHATPTVPGRIVKGSYGRPMISRQTAARWLETAGTSFEDVYG